MKGYIKHAGTPKSPLPPPLGIYLLYYSHVHSVQWSHLYLKSFNRLKDDIDSGYSSNYHNDPINAKTLYTKRSYEILKWWSIETPK